MVAGRILTDERRCALEDETLIGTGVDERASVGEGKEGTRAFF